MWNMMKITFGIKAFALSGLRNKTHIFDQGLFPWLMISPLRGFGLHSIFFHRASPYANDKGLWLRRICDFRPF